MIGQALNTGDPLNRSHPLARGLVSFWLGLPGLQGYRLFDYAGGNHGTLTNGPAWTAGPNGFGSLSFDGTNTGMRVEVPSNAALNPTGVFSVAADFRINGPSSGSTNYQSIIYKGSNNVTAGAYSFRLITDGAGTTLYTGLNTGSEVFGSTSITLDRRYRAVLVYDGTNLKLYLDGVEVTSTAVGGGAVVTNANPLYLGGGPGGGSTVSINGLVYAAGFWPGRAFSASDAAAWHDQSRRGFPDLLRRQTRRSVGVVTSPPPPPPSYFLPAVAGLGW